MTAKERQVADELMRTGKSGMTIGGHFYPKAPQRSSYCAYDCGCWMGPSRSGGPVWAGRTWPEDTTAKDVDNEVKRLDPFGFCPNNIGAI